MTAFRFRLESLLAWRRTALDQQRAQLADALRADALLHDQLRDLERQREAAQQERRTAAGVGRVDADAALQAQRLELLLAAQRAALAEQRQKLAEAIDRQRRSVAEAHREVKVLEKLRERRLAEHHAAEQRREGAQLDEVAARRREEP